MNTSEMNTSAAIESRLARIEELLMNLKPNNTPTKTVEQPTHQITEKGMKIKYDLLAVNIKKEVCKILTTNGLDTAMLDSINFEDLILSAIDPSEYNNILIKELNRNDSVDVGLSSQSLPSLSQESVASIEENTHKAPKTSTKASIKAPKSVITNEEKEAQNGMKQADKESKQYETAVKKQEKLAAAAAEPKVTKSRSSKSSVPIDKEAKEAQKKAEKEAKDAQKKAEKEAKDAQKKAEKEAKDAQKKAEKEAKEAKPSAKGSKSKKPSISTSQTSSQALNDNLNIDTDITTTNTVKPTLAPLIHPDQFTQTISEKSYIEEEPHEEEEQDDDHSSNSDEEDEEEEEEPEKDKHNFTILTNYSIPSKPDILYLVQQGQYVYECKKSSDAPTGTIDWNNSVGVMSGTGNLIYSLNFKEYKSLMVIS